jgi:hypothetical protein
MLLKVTLLVAISGAIMIVHNLFYTIYTMITAMPLIFDGLINESTYPMYQITIKN